MPSHEAIKRYHLLYKPFLFDKRGLAYNRSSAPDDPTAFQTPNPKRDAMKPIKSVVLLLSVLFLFHSVAFGMDDEITRNSLKGLEGIYVAIILDGGSKQAGLSKSLLRTDVEVKLRMAGIKLVSQYESFNLPGMPWLGVNINSLIHGKSIYYQISLELIQGAFLERKNLHTIAITWDIGRHGVTSNIENIRSSIKDMADQFINAYRSVNPKK